MKSTPASIEGLLIIEPTVFGDERGFFMETYSRDRYAEMGLPREFVQDNLSLFGARDSARAPSSAPERAGKALPGARGRGVRRCRRRAGRFADLRRWEGVRLSSENKRQLYVPPGFAHGFCVLSERALFSYKCTDFYSAATELGVAWNDPDIGIDWPIDAPRLSAKDAKNPRLKDIPEGELPNYG